MYWERHYLVIHQATVEAEVLLRRRFYSHGPINFLGFYILGGENLFIVFIV